MLRFAPLFMLLIIVPKLFYKSGALVAFEANREYIAEAFCINKAKPELDCGGKCHLAEMLQEENEAPDAPSIPVALEIDLIIPEELADSPFALPAESLRKPNSYLATHFASPHLAVAVPPPRC